jgi:hypothetical protein
MKPTNPVYIGAPLTGDEARFLRALAQRFEGTEHLILANFLLADQQIDFVLVTSTGASLIELKGFPRAVFGEKNGSWECLDASGAKVRYPGGNPYQQTLKQKFALSDAMRKFHSTAVAVPPAAGAGFFADFAAFVCITPEIAVGSRVIKGDFKVAVVGCADMFAAIENGGPRMSWRLQDWERFAIEHLTLERTTAEAATDAKVRRAETILAGYRARVRALLGADLPPLLPAGSGKALRGTALIARLLDPRNYLLTGPTGTAKTFHLHHLALAIEAGDLELPVLLEAKKYRGGDFWQALRQSSAPFSYEDPKELLEAGLHRGLRPVLLLDAMNECSEPHRPDLLKGAQAFILRYSARLVATSQNELTLPADLAAEIIGAVLPDRSDRRAIYAHHAGVGPTEGLDTYCAGFANAYDLTIAGRCHGAGAPPSSRADLYDRYIRNSVPEHASVVTALMRKVAARMGDAYVLALARDTFVRTAESVLEAAQAPLGILDHLPKIRFVRLSNDHFTFEHELLFDYFRAEELRRRTVNIAELVHELRRPRNGDLIEFILPRLADADDVAQVLSIVSDTLLLSRILAGECGVIAQRELNAACLRVLDEAMADLPNLSLRCHITERDQDGARVIVDVQVEGHREWSAYDGFLCQVIAKNVKRPELAARFLDLLDATEWTLRSAAEKAAAETGVGRRYTWGEVVRLYAGTLWRGRMSLPCGDVLRAFQAEHSFSFGEELRERLIERVLRQPQSDFALAGLLADRTGAYAPERVEENMALVQRAWDSGIYIQRLHGLEFARSMRSAVETAGPDALAAMRALLGRCETKNVFVNTVLLETLGAYDALQLDMDAESAAREMRALIGPGASDSDDVRQVAELLEVERASFLASRAKSCIDRIFEDVFQGIYWEAYAELSSAEKFDLLTLALSEGDRDGMFLDWMLRELIKIGDPRAIKTCRMFASEVQAGSSYPQGATAAYVLGIEGCARWDETPVERPSASDPVQAAWHTLGDILFWLHKDRTRYLDTIAALWRRIDGATLIAAGDVLFRLSGSSWCRQSETTDIDLAVLFPSEARRIAEGCLGHEAILPSAFSFPTVADERLVTFLITTLGGCGDSDSLVILKVYAEMEKFGRAAIEAIESIQQRRLRDHASRTNGAAP